MADDTPEIEEALVACLAAIADLQAAVGGRLFPVYAPENTPPTFAVYRRLGTERSYNMGGCDNPVGSTFRVTFWARTYAAAKAAAAILRGYVHGDVAAAALAAGAQAWAIADEADIFDPSPELQERQLFGRYLDIRIDHDE